MRTGRRDKKLNNAGLSLVELVVVIAIMAVMAGGTASIVIAVNNAKTKSCAQSIYTDIARVKANTLAKQKGLTPAAEYYFKLKTGPQGEIVAEERVEESAVIEKVIGVKELTVTYSGSGASGVNVATTPAECKFDRSSGAVKSSNFETIKVAGARAEYEITLYPATGKVKMERTK